MKLPSRRDEHTDHGYVIRVLGIFFAPWDYPLQFHSPENAVVIPQETDLTTCTGHLQGGGPEYGGWESVNGLEKLSIPHWLNSRFKKHGAVAQCNIFLKIHGCTTRNGDFGAGYCVHRRG